LVYSFETFIPYEINRASREQDKSKIATLGPFACALEEIVKYALQSNLKNQKKEIEPFTVWRGLQMH
jgi:hypothetical protein